jgi:DNA (cytosine-5)-methyltransferase 1
MPPKTSAVPTVKKRRKLTCIDLFAGCGGLSLGLENANFHPLLFSEINGHAAETYEANRPKGVKRIGDIYKLTDPDLKGYLEEWKKEGVDEVDLVCGGPPCQGYSGIGHRRTFKLAKEDIPSNHLFLEMVRVIRCVQPKMFLFENVRGLLNARWTPSGKKGEIFKAVMEAFQSIDGYTIQWDLLHAKSYGVPQNRPRVIMIGIRNNVLTEKLKRFKEKATSETPFGVESGFIPAPSEWPPNIEELLSDLVDPEYLGKSATPTYLKAPTTDIQRKLRTRLDGTIAGVGEPLSEQEYSNHADYIQKKFAFMIANNGEIPEKYKTKKFAQRVLPTLWGDEGPNITATSLPEDYVHYSQPRSPTVREWARIQTFPDWYQFKGPRTTGGRRRAGDPSKGIWDRDVPRYTQIGNAVPVLLAEKIGLHLASILLGKS